MANVESDKEESLLWKDALSICQTEAELTRVYGDHTLAFFGLAPENEHFLVPDGKGLVNYRLVDHVAVVLGDPLCPPEALARVTRCFLDFCTSRRWSVAFYQARPECLAAYSALRLRALKIGEEALLSPQTFTLQGSALANVRTSCRRAEREGVHLEWYEGVLPAAVLQQLEGVSRAWLERKGGEQGQETGFSVGRLNEVTMSAQRADWIADLTLPSSTVQPTTPRLVTGVAMTGFGNACAFVTFTPIYGAATGDSSARQGWGWALDLMRRTPDASPGVMELLLVGAIERFRREGAHVVSLGLVAGADSQQEMSAHQRQLASFVTDRLGLLESSRTLFSFKQKFHPCWKSRYLVIPTPLALPKIALTVLRMRNYSGGVTKLVKRSFWQFLRYCLVGGANTLIDLLMLNLLLWRFPTSNVQVLVGYNSLAYMSGAVSSFFCNKYWTFRRVQRTNRREVRRFAISLLLEILYSNGLIWLAGKALHPWIGNITLWGNVSKLVAVVVGTMSSYLVMRFWTFASAAQDRPKER
ncbi:DUF2156 domain-containing protein [Ktedonobacteria bacterium brp13]|nr:DUF2156 domain-containing protein [Ktedonobacteria bacterium brp13]